MLGPAVAMQPFIQPEPESHDEAIMKKPIEKPAVKEYGTFLAVTLRKKSRPGDGTFGKGVKGG